MKRGVVMSIQKQHLVVMTADGQFVKVPNSGSTQLGEEISFEEEYKSRRRFSEQARYLTGAAAIVLVLGVSILMMAMRDTHAVVAYLSMDINPSVEFGVDKGELVQELRALNKDGEKIIEGIAYKGISLDEVASAVIEKAKQSHYLDLPDRDIVITSMLLDDKKVKQLDYDQFLAGKISKTLIGMLAEAAAESSKTNVTTLTLPIEMRNEAAANGVSSGKLAVYLMAKNEGYEVELEQFKGQSIDKVVEPIGGMKTIIENAEDTSKQKMKELLEREQAEMKLKSALAAEKTAATAKPPASPSAVPAKQNGKNDREDKWSGNGNGKRGNKNSGDNKDDKKSNDKSSAANKDKDSKKNSSEKNSNRDKRSGKDSKDNKDSKDTGISRDNKSDDRGKDNNRNQSRSNKDDDDDDDRKKDKSGKAGSQNDSRSSSGKNSKSSDNKSNSRGNNDSNQNGGSGNRDSGRNWR